MQQLSEHDAAYIYSDDAHANSNVTMVYIYDQSTAPGGMVRFRQILEHVEGRLGRLPMFRRKVLRVPLDLDYPYWVEDENFDIDFHVRHAALPKPGDWRQFCIQVARLHARPLDLNRPLWEMYVIEGLDSFLDLPAGSFAVVLKLHHAAADVSQSNEITAILHDLSPVVSSPPPPEPWFPEDVPGNVQLLARAAFNLATFPLRIAQPLARNWASLQATWKAFMGEFLGTPHDFPMTRFNTVVSSRRVFETRRFARQEFEAIRKLVPGVTVDDAVLAVCAGGLRRYLEMHGELPEESLIATVPIGMVRRKVDDGQGLSWVRIDLATDIPDAIARMKAIKSARLSPRLEEEALGAHGLSDLAQQAPSAAIAVSSRVLRSASALLGDWSPLANCAIAEVAGPPAPLYLQGARLSYQSALMPIFDGMGLVFSVTRYQEMVIVSFTGCYEQLPDPEVFAQCLRDEFQDYLAMARNARAPGLQKAPKTSKPRVPAASSRAPSRARAAAKTRPATRATAPRRRTRAAS